MIKRVSRLSVERVVAKARGLLAVRDLSSHQVKMTRKMRWLSIRISDGLDEKYRINSSQTSLQTLSPTPTSQTSR